MTPCDNVSVEGFLSQLITDATEDLMEKGGNARSFLQGYFANEARHAPHMRHLERDFIVTVLRSLA
jgi:hypothetical protein